MSRKEASAAAFVLRRPEPDDADELAAGRLLAPWGFGATGGFWVLATPEGAADPRVDALAGWLQEQLAG